MRLNGIVPPLVTPLEARDRLDTNGLERLIQRQLDAGVAGLFVLGSTGEAPSLSYRVRREMLQLTANLASGAVPLLAGITDTSYVESVQLAYFAAESGYDAVVLAPPYYFPAGQIELLGYVRQLAAESPLPLMLYNMPALTKVWFDLPTLRELSTVDRIIGVKDSSGDLDYFAQVCRLKQSRPDWSVLIGPEALLDESLQRGGDGGVAGGANVFPDWFVEWYAAIIADDKVAAAESKQKIVALQQIYEIGKYASRHIKATKCALSLLGICSDLPSDPFRPFLAPQRAQVAKILRGLIGEPLAS